jgi:hypothetical protein
VGVRSSKLSENFVLLEDITAIIWKILAGFYPNSFLNIIIHKWKRTSDKRNVNRNKNQFSIASTITSNN